MTFKKDRDGRTMPSEMINELLKEAKLDVQGKIVKYGGDTRFLMDYQTFHQGVLLEAWQDHSEENYRLTYDAVLDMIVGLQKNIERLNNVECTMSLSLVVGGRSRLSGRGVVRFGSHSHTSRNRRISSSFNRTKEMVNHLGADRWD